MLGNRLKVFLRFLVGGRPEPFVVFHFVEVQLGWRLEVVFFPGFEVELCEKRFVVIDVVLAGDFYNRGDKFFQE